MQAERLRPLADGYAILLGDPQRRQNPAARAGLADPFDPAAPQDPDPLSAAGPQGVAALATATRPEEGACTSTTSAKTSSRPAASGPRSLGSVSSFSGSISPRPAAAPLRPSSVFAVPAISATTLQRLLPLVASSDDVAEEITEAWKEADHRKAQREPRRRSHAPTLRCPACKTFVTSTRRCSCGYTPGLGWAA